LLITTPVFLLVDITCVDIRYFYEKLEFFELDKIGLVPGMVFFPVMLAVISVVFCWLFGLRINSSIAFDADSSIYSVMRRNTYHPLFFCLNLPSFLRILLF